MDDFFQEQSHSPGLRLHKLEMLNWGTFDSSGGRVFTIEPRGRTTLAVGENGAGKSTLSDALLTLLVNPTVRTYNVAAASAGGARKRDRSQRTYIRGLRPQQRWRQDDLATPAPRPRRLLGAARLF